MSINRYYIFIDRSFSSPTAREHQDTPTTTKGNFPRCDTVIIPDGRGWRPRQPAHAPPKYAKTPFDKSNSVLLTPSVSRVL